MSALRAISGALTRLRGQIVDWLDRVREAEDVALPPHLVSHRRGAWSTSGGSLLLGALVAAVGVTLWAGGVSGSVLWVVVVTAVAYAAVPALVAWYPRRSVAAALVGLFVTQMVFLGLHDDGVMVVASPWWALITVFAMYQGGFTLGLIALTCVVAGNVLIVAVHEWGAPLPFHIGLHSDTWLYFVGQLCGVLATGVIGLMFHDAQNRLLRDHDRASERLRESQGRLEALVNNTTDLICSVTRGLRIAAHNEAFEHFFGDAEAGGLDRGVAILPLLPEAHRGTWRQRLFSALYGERSSFTEQHEVGGTVRHVEFHLNPIRVDGEVVGVAVFGRDLTDRVQAEERLQDANRQLVDLSRRAGMAEVATGILHNVGNVLNSVNVSATSLRARVGDLRVDPLRRLLPLLDDAPGNRDRLRAYLASLAEHLSGEKSQLISEIGALNRNVEHLTTILQAQRRFAGAPGLVENTTAERLVDESLELVTAALEKAGATVTREIGLSLPLRTDRHKAIDILVQLLTNAAEAVGDGETRDIHVSVSHGEGDTVRIAVVDSGHGIAPDAIPRLFELGFSTREGAHGMGLHTSAIAARQLGGRLVGTSDGPGRGAAFILELPLAS